MKHPFQYRFVHEKSKKHSNKYMEKVSKYTEVKSSVLIASISN